MKFRIFSTALILLLLSACTTLQMSLGSPGNVDLKAKTINDSLEDPSTTFNIQAVYLTTPRDIAGTKVSQNVTEVRVYVTTHENTIVVVFQGAEDFLSLKTNYLEQFQWIKTNLALSSPWLSFPW